MEFDFASRVENILAKGIEMRLARYLLIGILLFGWFVGAERLGRADDKAADAGKSAEKMPELVGSHWQLLSLTGKGEKIEDAKNPADMEFTKGNKWGILHYGGRREAGTFEMKDNHLIMKNESGEVYQDAKMTWKPETKMLELFDGEYLMRLKLFKPK